ncbi:hypothetical protein [Streptomyces sp. XH2]|uniref:hypothetical protein n=1 Tax=Streptomyces sp. XH2 TaxID=3412483 RepID=UPI003C798684
MTTTHGHPAPAFRIRPATDARRQGIGSALLARVREAAPGAFSPHVFQRNDAAIAFERCAVPAVPAGALSGVSPAAETSQEALLPNLDHNVTG